LSTPRNSNKIGIADLKSEIAYFKNEIEYQKKELNKEVL